jgi:hypothetical protein
VERSSKRSDLLLGDHVVELVPVAISGSLKIERTNGRVSRLNPSMCQMGIYRGRNGFMDNVMIW